MTTGPDQQHEAGEGGAGAPSQGEWHRLAEEITARIEVRAAYADVEQLLRLRPDHVVALAYLQARSTEDGRYDAVLTARGWRRWLRLPARIEFSRTAGQRAHAVMHLVWRSRRWPHLFPVMEANLTLRPLSQDRTELAFDGGYRPPGGVVGLLADVLVGRRIALSTAEAFLEDLRAAVESDLARPAS